MPLFLKISQIYPWVLCASCLSFSATADATEGGGSNYLPGFYGDFSMATLPDQGTFFNNFFAAYQDTQAQTGALLEMPGILHVTGQKYLDANFFVALFPAVMAIKDSTGNNNLDRVGLGDFYVVPAGLSWKTEHFSAMLFEGVVAPTGRYAANDFNIGRNYWTFDHNLLLTWNIPYANEISLGIGYMNNLENPSTRYRSGDEFHLDFTLGHYVASEFAVGLTGSYYQQTTADAAPLGQPLNVTGQAATLGPVLMYSPKINGQDVAFSLKWLREYTATGREMQEYLVFRIFLPL